jgi:hypothetical protein
VNQDPARSSRSITNTWDWRRVDVASNFVLARIRQLISGGMPYALARRGLRIAAGNLERRNYKQLEGTPIMGSQSEARASLPGLAEDAQPVLMGDLGQVSLSVAVRP